jgi:nitroreductase
MEYVELINTRYSVRAYKSTPVEEHKLSFVLNAARLAPTAANHQPFQIIVVQTKGREDNLLSIFNRNWFVQAPLVICICGLLDEGWIRTDNRRYLDVDIAIVMDHLVLAATDQGLGTCIVAAFDSTNARKLLAIPDNAEPILFTPLGYPNDQPGTRIRKGLEELVRYEHW